MRVHGLLRAAAVAAIVCVPPAIGTAAAQTKITVGKTTGGSGFHIPTYVAMDQGFYQAEGLDARFIAMTGKALVTAGLSGNVDFVPIPSGGAQAALSGAELRYVVGQSLKSQWVIIARPEITKVEDLKGKVMGYGRAGSADYDEGATVLARFFNLEAGKDYKVISFQGEPERIAALINGDIQGGLVSAPHAAKAKTAGLRALIRTGDYLPRVGGTVWTTKDYVEKNPETVKKFVRAIGKAVMYFRDNRAGSIATLKTHLGVPTDEEAGYIWDELHNTFGAELPKDLFREIFESRRIDMVAA
ncbi:MAG: ABC transporter substrate-binding protein, partial [Alphaproteobacteria bacterium]